MTLHTRYVKGSKGIIIGRGQRTSPLNEPPKEIMEGNDSRGKLKRTIMESLFGERGHWTKVPYGDP